MWQHRSGAVPGFTRRYGVKQLVWFEAFDEVATAIQRGEDPEALVAGLEDRPDQAGHPAWRDLYDEIAG